MGITKETITFTCPSCGHTTKRHAVIKELSEGRKPTCEECGTEIVIDREVMARIEEILGRLGLPNAGRETPPGPAGVTPKRGCLGVMAVLTLSALMTIVLICVFL